MSALLYRQGLAVAMAGEKFFTGSLHALPETDSTMNRIAEAIAHGHDDGFTVIALHQTSGSGSGARKWLSGTGNLLFSRLIEIQPHEYGQEMEMIAAGAIKEIIQELLPDRDVVHKYPNDVLIDGAKICGCLVRPADDVKAGMARKINLGVGVNLKNAPRADRPTTCLADHGIDTDIAAFMPLFDRRFAQILADYRQSQNFDSVLNHMGFLDRAGKLTLIGKGNQRIMRGLYQGFRIIENRAYIGIDDGFYTTHGHYMISACPRGTVLPAHRREAFVYG